MGEGPIADIDRWHAPRSDHLGVAGAAAGCRRPPSARPLLWPAGARDLDAVLRSCLIRAAGRSLGQRDLSSSVSSFVHSFYLYFDH